MRRFSDNQENSSQRTVHVLRTVLIIIGILLFSIIAFFLYYFVVQMLNPSIPPLPVVQTARVELEPQVIEAEAVKQLEINSSYTMVTVKPGRKGQPQATVRIEESYDDDGYDHSPSEWSISGSVLRIDSTDGGDAWHDAKYTVITVSPDILAQLEKTTITCQTGDVYLYNFTSGILNAKVGAGSLHVDNTTAPTLKIDVASGFAELDGTFDTVNLSVTSGNGNLVAKGTPSRISCSVQSGKAIIVLPKELGFTAHTSVEVGEVTFDQKVEKREDRSVVYGDGSLKLDVSVTSGSIHVTQQ